MHAAYGGPEALCRFVDRAHALGLAVLLDVVHNHIGPSGNYWERFGPFFTDGTAHPGARRSTWTAPARTTSGTSCWRARSAGCGTSISTGCAWTPSTSCTTTRARSYLEELTEAVAALAAELGRPLPIIAESDRNDPRTVLPTVEGGTGLTAQWDDDLHHALHWLLTGEAQGYYADFASLEAVAHAFEHAFWHDGRMSTFRGRVHGRPVDFARTPPTRFVASTQNHDQVGNRAAGERLSQLVPPSRLAAGAALLLTLPYVPLLFMGEEWGASTPFLFFSSFEDPELGAAVTQGRRSEFAEHGWGEAVPDPQDPATRDASVLQWAESGSGWHRDLAEWYRALIAWRRGTVDDLPLVRYEEGVDGRPTWFAVTAGQRTAVCNFSDSLVELTSAGGEPVLDLCWPPSSAELAGTVLQLQPESTVLLRGWLPG